MFHSLRPVVSAPCRSVRPRLLIAGLALSAFLAAALHAPPAHAGSYTETGSGGTTPATVTPAAASQSTSSPSPTDATATAAVTPMSPDGIPTYTIQVSPGTITDTFTWTHGKNPDGTTQTDADDPPPACVLVEQLSGATWYVRMENGTGTGDGKADCGLSGGTVTTSTYGGNGPSSSLSAVLWSQKSGSSFPVSCSPTASFTGTTGSSGLVSGEATVSGGASVYPITIVPNGAAKDSTTGAYSLLTGQQVSTGLTGLPFTPGPGSTYQWSAGGDTFYTYNAQAPSHQLVLLSDNPSYTTSPGFSFYDKSAESVTITCKAVLVCPNGNSVTINASSQPITVKKPTAGWSAYATAPFVNASGGYGVNEYWQPITISVPPPFSGGLGCFAQLITPSRQATRSFSAGTPMVYAATYYDKAPDGNGGWMLPMQGLDTSFPYPFVTGGNSDGSWPVSNAVTSGDMPTAPYNPPAVSGDAGGTNWYTATTQDSFMTWLMYQPAGGIWVPLQKLVWSTNITVTNAGGPWAVSSGSAATTAKSGTDAKDPPGWTTVNNASQAQMRP